LPAAANGVSHFRDVTFAVRGDFEAVAKRIRESRWRSIGSA
jgi:hypothetical protein